MITLEQTYNQFIGEKEIFTSKSTVRYYRDNVRYFNEYIEQELGQTIDQIDVSILSITHYNGFVKYKKSHNKRVNHPFAPVKQTKIKNRSINTYLRAIKTYLKWLYTEEFIEKDISIKCKYLINEKPVIIPIYKEEFESILSPYNPRSRMGLRNIILLRLMIDMGFRASDTLNLKIENVMFNKHMIYISEGKGLKDRLVPLPTNLSKLLLKYIHQYRILCDHEYVLQNQDGTQMTYNSVKNLFERIRKRTDIKRLKPHLLRHTFATSYLIHGGTIVALRIWLGHSDINTTDKYNQMANTYKYMKDMNIYRIDNAFFKFNNDALTL